MTPDPLDPTGIIPRLPDGRIDWLILEGYAITLFMGLGTVALFVAWLIGWRP